MNKIKGVLRSTIMQRPFDFYVATLLFLAGFYSIVSDTWPERVGNGLTHTFITIVSVYLMIASGVVMAAFSCKRAKKPIFTLMGEMYGWLFISAGSLATTLMYIGSVISNEPSSWGLWAILLFVWSGMAIASGVRFLDLLYVYRSIKNQWNQE